MIIELFCKSYQLIKDNLILVQPLLLFLMLLGFILAPISIGGLSIVFFFIVLSLFCAFSSGWFNMFHKCVNLSDKQGLSREEKALNSINLLKEFFPGVGKYFYKILLGSIIYIVLLFIVVNLFGGIIGDRLIGYPESVNSKELMNAFISGGNSLEFLNKITDTDKIKVLLWNGLSFIILVIFSYLTMFWIHSVIVEDKGIIKAYLESLKTVLKRPFTSSVIFISYWGSIIGIGFLGSRGSLNFIVHLVLLMLLALVFVYFTMMTFLYFEKYRKNNCNSWTDSFR